MNEIEGVVIGQLFDGLLECEVVNGMLSLCVDTSANSNAYAAFLSLQDLQAFIALLEEKAIQMLEAQERMRLLEVLQQRLKVASLYELRNVRAALDGDVL